MTKTEKDQLRLVMMHYNNHVKNILKTMNEYEGGTNTYLYAAGLRDGYASAAEYLYIAFPFLEEPDTNGYYYPQEDGAK